MGVCPFLLRYVCVCVPPAGVPLLWGGGDRQGALRRGSCAQKLFAFANYGGFERQEIYASILCITQCRLL